MLQTDDLPLTEGHEPARTARIADESDLDLNYLIRRDEGMETVFYEFNPELVRDSRVRNLLEKACAKIDMEDQRDIVLFHYPTKSGAECSLTVWVFDSLPSRAFFFMPNHIFDCSDEVLLGMLAHEVAHLFLEHHKKADRSFLERIQAEFPADGLAVRLVGKDAVVAMLQYALAEAEQTLTTMRFMMTQIIKARLAAVESDQLPTFYVS